MYMVNLLQSTSIKEAQTASNSILGGTSLAQGSVSSNTNPGFQNLLQQSKSDQVSPLGVKKLAAAVLQASDLSPSGQGAGVKQKLSELSGDELLQFLMAQTELASMEDAVPEHLASWLDSEQPPVDVESSHDQSLLALGLTEADQSDSTVPPELLSVYAQQLNGESVDVTDITPTDTEIKATDMQSDAQSTELDANAIIGNLTETASDLNELSPEAQPLSTADTVALNISNIATAADKANGIAVANLAAETNKSSLNPLNDVLKAESNSKSDAMSALSGLDENGELKPISLLATTDETKTTDALKAQVSSESTVKVASSSQDAKNMELLTTASAALKEPDATSTPLQNPTTAIESAKIERTIMDTVNTLNTAQKQVKLPDITPALSDRIFTMIKNDIQHGFIRLDPPELGALEVRIQVTQESTHIQIVSQSQQVREALESQSVRLRESMAEQGLNLSSLDVNDQSTGDSSAQSEGGQNNQSGVDDGALESQNIDSDNTVSASNSLVDHYV